MKKVVFTNGVFDVLHDGHREIIKFCATLGGEVVVAINSDRATKLLGKGPDRPINNEAVRKKAMENMLKELGVSGRVVIFDDTKTIGTILELQPNVVVKGGEWTVEEVRRRDQIPDHIEVEVFKLVTGPSGEKLSSTALIERMSG